jgi:hypothetical protein
MWKVNGKLNNTDTLVLHHGALCSILETAICYDQLEVTNLASIELILRQIQSIEERLQDRFIDDHEFGADYGIMSGLASRSSLCICPALTSHVAAEASKRTAVLKERRKAREERALLRPGPKKGAKGDG